MIRIFAWRSVYFWSSLLRQQGKGFRSKRQLGLSIIKQNSLCADEKVGRGGRDRID